MTYLTLYWHLAMLWLLDTFWATWKHQRICYALESGYPDLVRVLLVVKPRCFSISVFGASLGRAQPVRGGDMMASLRGRRGHPTPSLAYVVHARGTLLITCRPAGSAVWYVPYIDRPSAPLLSRQAFAAAITDRWVVYKMGRKGAPLEVVVPLAGTPLLRKLDVTVSYNL